MEFDDFFNTEGFKKISFDQFDEFINRLNLKPKYSIFENEKGDIIVDEEWSTKSNKSIKVNRFYKFNIDLLDIPENKRVKLLEQALKIYVDSERYEEAAIIRDTIKTISI